MKRIWVVLWAIVSMNTLLFLSACPVSPPPETVEHGNGGGGGGGY